MPATNPTSVLSMQNWFSTTLSSPCGSTDTTLSLTNTPTPSEGYLILDPNNTSTREVIHYTSVGTGTVTLPGSGDRGIDGTNATTHAQGTAVVMNYTTSYFTALQKGYALSLGAIGAQNLSNPYKFRVFVTNASLALPISSNKITFDAKSYDTSSNVDIVTNKGRFTAPVAGFYYFTASAQLSTSTNDDYGIALYKNGSIVSQGGFSHASTGSTKLEPVVSDTLQLAPNDYVEAYAYTTNSGGLQVLNGASVSYFSGFLLSAT